ncbi:MAG: hypothetical protein HYZ50_05570 [Deltaproteobacteria bacterium]|nr:hypothetical protein [Deltaproteobacteria bacterium]
MIITGPIESFFKNPSSEPLSEGDGILFHLRRDLVKLLGAEDQHFRDASPHAMLSLMGVLAGIDYLSQVYSTAKGSRKRFVETVRELCKIAEEDSQAIYQLRCAIIHSIALSTISACDYRKGDRFNFEITDDDACPLIEKRSDNGSEVAYRIGFWQLRETFLNIVSILENIARGVGDPKNPHVLNMIGQMHSEKILKAE